MSEKQIKCNECGRACYPYVYKGPNNTYLCGQGWVKGINACGGNVCFKCGKIETRTEWRKEEDCCGNEVMREREVEMFYQTEKDENDPDRQLKVYYCDEHKEEAKKSPLVWTKADNERIAKQEEQRKWDIAEKLNSQGGLFYCQDAYAHAVEQKKQIKGIKYGCFEFWGRENGKSFYLLIPDTHPVLNNFKYQEKEKRDGAEVEFTRYNLQEKFFLIEGIEKLSLEANRDSEYSGNDPLIQAQHFSKVVGLNDKITITPIDSQGKPEKEQSTDNLPNFQPKEWSDRNVLQFFQKSNIQSIKIKGGKLIIKYNHKEEEEEEEEPNTNELKQTKSYLQKIGKQELSLSDLEQSNNQPNTSDNKSNKDLYIGLAATGILTVGIIAWLLMRNKKNKK